VKIGFCDLIGCSVASASFKGTIKPNILVFIETIEKMVRIFQFS